MASVISRGLRQASVLPLRTMALAASGGLATTVVILNNPTRFTPGHLLTTAKCMCRDPPNSACRAPLPEDPKTSCSKPKLRMSQTAIGAPAPSFKGTAVVDGDFGEILLQDYNGKPKLTMSQTAIGAPAPSFKGTVVVDGDFGEISLQDYNGKYLVLFFYPLDFTFVCPTEIIAFSDRVEEFRKIGCEVVAASTDSHFSHLAWVNIPRNQGGLGDMKIPLLADKTCDIAKRYGVLKEDEGIAFRGLFIIDSKQNLRQITINDLPVGRSVDETLRLVQAFQFTDERGEVCPAGWNPGADSMKANPKEALDYFQKHN